MWSLLNRLSRPPLGHRLAARGEVLNRRARLLLDGAATAGADAEDLAGVLGGSSACWDLVRKALPASRRRLSARHRRRVAAVVDRLVTNRFSSADCLESLAGHARSKGECRSLQRLAPRLAAVKPRPIGRRNRRALATLLTMEATWFDALAQSRGLPDGALEAGLLRLYRRARRAALEHPRSTRARRRLTALVRAEELIFAAAGPITGSDQTGSFGIVGRRALLELLQQDAQLADLDRRVRVAVRGDEQGLGSVGDKQAARFSRVVRRRRQELKGEIRVAAKRAFPEAVAEYRRQLPWRTFLVQADSQLLDHGLTRRQSTSRENRCDQTD